MSHGACATKGAVAGACSAMPRAGTPFAVRYFFCRPLTFDWRLYLNVPVFMQELFDDEHVDGHLDQLGLELQMLMHLRYSPLQVPAVAFPGFQATRHAKASAYFAYFMKPSPHSTPKR